MAGTCMRKGSSSSFRRPRWRPRHAPCSAILGRVVLLLHRLVPGAGAGAAARELVAPEGSASRWVPCSRNPSDLSTDDVQKPLLGSDVVGVVLERSSNASSFAVGNVAGGTSARTSSPPDPPRTRPRSWAPMRRWRWPSTSAGLAPPESLLQPAGRQKSLSRSQGLVWYAGLRVHRQQQQQQQQHAQQQQRQQDGAGLRGSGGTTGGHSVVKAFGATHRCDSVAGPAYCEALRRR